MFFFFLLEDLNMGDNIAYGEYILLFERVMIQRAQKKLHFFVAASVDRLGDCIDIRCVFDLVG